VVSQAFATLLQSELSAPCIVARQPMGDIVIEIGLVREQNSMSPSNRSALLVRIAAPAIVHRFQNACLL